MEHMFFEVQLCSEILIFKEKHVFGILINLCLGTGLSLGDMQFCCLDPQITKSEPSQLQQSSKHKRSLAEEHGVVGLMLLEYNKTNRLPKGDRSEEFDVFPKMPIFAF